MCWCILIPMIIILGTLRIHPLEYIELENEEDDAKLCALLNPKVIQILTNYATIELNGKKYKVHRHGVY